MKNIMEQYSQYLTENGKRPVTVAAFTKSAKSTEDDFYKQFSSFEHLEEKIFEQFHSNTVELLEKQKEYADYDSRTKLISYYFTFFEILNANRSLVFLLLDKSPKDLIKERKLRSLKVAFQDYIDSLDIDIYNFGVSYLELIHEKGIREMAWIQLLMTLKFWKEDTSPGFEKTDVFIEKSLKASFDIVESSPIESIVDFGKFLFHESRN